MMGEFNKVYRHIETQRGEILDEQMKVKDEILNEIEALKLNIHKIEDDQKVHKFNLDKHTQIIREYELKQNILQSHVQQIFADKSNEISEDLGRFV